MPSVQPGKTRYTIERDLIEPTSRFLAEVGQAGYEAVAVWIGRLEPGDEAVCERVYAPEQISYRGPEGVSVRIPEGAITELIRSSAQMNGFCSAFTRIRAPPTTARWTT